MWPAVFAISISEFLEAYGLLILVSIVTLVHTVDETRGRIWDFLNVPVWLYFGFQVLVGYFGWMATMTDPVVLPFVVVRVADVIVTHLILGAPGKWTAPLLIGDAVFVSLGGWAA